MKKLIITLILLTIQQILFSQNLDLIVITNGDSIACKIDKLSQKYIYYMIKIDDEWISSQVEKGLIADYWINSNKKMYKTWLTLKSEPFISKGILTKVKSPQF